jgi:two-component system, sensor histidine kinase and response regulator
MKPKSDRPVILIVDDNANNLKVLGNMLAGNEYELALAMNGQQALDTVARINPDLVLLDIMMPVMDGYEVCRQLKDNEATKDIPVIFLTAKTETEDIVKGFDLGAVDYISKPFVSRELLARIKTHLSLQLTQRKLLNEITAKNKFFSIIAHDLRGSFTVILGFVEAMQQYRDEFSEEEFNELIQEMGYNAKSTYELFENLLYWARMQTSGIQINPEMLNADELVQLTLRPMLPIAQKKNILLNADISQKHLVFADSNMLQTVIRNLVSNAIKFTPEGGTISLSSEEKCTRIYFYITDTGLGIDEKKIEKLFRIDSKVSTPGTNNEKGSGLGLILCKEFVELNNGKIGIKSKPGEGTTVWFSLPVKA